jgi:hypothetical protein
MTAATDSNNVTSFYEDGEQVFPCPCGETHRGPYAIYDYGHHTCPHAVPLLRLAPDEIPEWLVCPLCGQTFLVAGASEGTNDGE